MSNIVDEVIINVNNIACSVSGNILQESIIESNIGILLLTSIRNLVIHSNLVSKVILKNDFILCLYY